MPIRNLLVPRCGNTASPRLRAAVTDLILAARRRRRRRRLALWGGIAAAAAAVVAGVILVPSPVTAADLLGNAVRATSGTVTMSVDVRTLPIENFSYTDPALDPVTHTVSSITRGDTLVAWRVDKGGCVACGTADGYSLWRPGPGVGIRACGSPDDVVYFLSSLLVPRRILNDELRNVEHTDGATSRVSVSGDSMLLHIDMPPVGDFTNPYNLDRSITDSHTLRTYAFDRTDGRLLGLSMRVVTAGAGDTVEVLRVHHIAALPEDADLLAEPEGIAWADGDWRGRLKGSPERAARTFLAAMERWDLHALRRGMRDSDLSRMAGTYRGARLVSVGESFISGAPMPVYVPYTLLMPDGSEVSFNLALNRDGDRWAVTGGI